ncbi:MAG: homogentisate 1,2-dioxygenase [Chloroflexi bacterium]|nr:homogentisate 1,2-dioxygenase [Chloroflexota bacterium]
MAGAGFQPQWTRGRTPRQAHVGLPEGTYEEEHGRHAFKGRASHLYRTHPPTAWVRVEGDLKPRAFDLNRLKTPDQSNPAAQWELLFWNQDVAIYVSKLSQPMPYFLRDADGDLCYFVHRGEGTLETDYGPLRFQTGDYLVVPKGTTHRFVPGTKDNFFYVIEGSGELRLPERGILGRHALFDPAVVDTPEPEPHEEKGEFIVRVKRDRRYTTLVYPFHPLDVVGWKGDLCPMRLNVSDFRPVVSPRYHLPPSVHVTWQCDGFEIGTFAPRPTETGDPTALRVPFFHANIDNDEVLFYHRGQFFSRAGIGEGYLTHHPQGIHHGPQPEAIKASKTKEFADEYAIMVEAERPLVVERAALAVTIEAYTTSWARGLGLIA